MKVEECIVTVERRSTGGCLDLAFVFAREFSGPLFRLWLICALPSCVLVWLLASVSAGMLIWSMVIFLFFSSVFSSLAGRLHRAAGVWRSDVCSCSLESVAKKILGLDVVEFSNAIYAGDYRILFCPAFHFCDVIRRAYAGSPVAGTVTGEQRHKTIELAGWWRWLQSQSGTIAGADGVLGGTVVWPVSDSGFSGDDAFQSSDLLQNSC